MTIRGGSTGEATMGMAIALFAPRIVYITANTKLPTGCIQLTEINCQSQAHINRAAGLDMSDGLL